VWFAAGGAGVQASATAQTNDKDFTINLKDALRSEAKTFLNNNGGQVTMYVYVASENNSGEETAEFLKAPLTTTAAVIPLSCTSGGGGGGENQPPVISSPADGTKMTIGVGESVNIQVVATDENEGDVLTYSAENMPSWLSLDSATGMFSGTAPSEAMTAQIISVTVRDLHDATAAVSFQVEVVGGAGQMIFKVKTDLRDRSDDSDSNVEVKIMPGQLSIVTQTDASGVSNSMVVPAAGSYTIWVKPYGYLAKQVSIEITGSGQVVDLGVFIGGDCSAVPGSGSYNKLNVGDYLVFVAEYNSQVIVCCDYNRNGEINTQDYIIFGNYYQDSRLGGKDGEGEAPPF
jgi:hypothetical protein